MECDIFTGLRIGYTVCKSNLDNLIFLCGFVSVFVSNFNISDFACWLVESWIFNADCVLLNNLSIDVGDLSVFVFFKNIFFNSFKWATEVDRFCSAEWVINNTVSNGFNTDLKASAVFIEVVAFNYETIKTEECTVFKFVGGIFNIFECIDAEEWLECFSESFKCSEDSSNYTVVIVCLGFPNSIKDLEFVVIPVKTVPLRKESKSWDWINKEFPLHD